MELLRNPNLAFFHYTLNSIQGVLDWIVTLLYQDWKKKFQFLYYWEFLEIMGLVLKILLFQLTFLDAVIPIMEDPLYQRSHTSSTCQCILIIMRMFMCVLAVYIVLGNSFQHQIFMCMVWLERKYHHTHHQRVLVQIFSFG